jgi:methylated-DNA-protein-cysteine methyltransferase related protein
MTRQYKSFDAVHALVRKIPVGEVASYGMIASLIPGATARIAGYAMAATPEGEAIPWWRVINSAGKISARKGNDASANRQQKRLEAEGIQFSKAGKVRWRDCRWQGPPEAWLEANKIDFMDFLEIQSRWPS